MQPHLKAGIDLGQTIDGLRDATLNDVLEGLVERTNLAYKDSFLYARDERLFGALGM